MIDYIHPDYELDEQPIVELLEDQTLIAGRVQEAILDVKLSEDESRQWLGTFEINGQRCQLQLVLTNIDSHFVDES